MSQSEPISFDADDPRLTAYVLDELEPAERIEMEQLLAASPEARAAVDEIRETIGVLNSAYDSEPIRELEPLDRNSAAVVQTDAMTLDRTTPRRRKSRRAILSLAGMVVVASLLVVIMVNDRADQSASRPSGDTLALFEKNPSAIKAILVDNRDGIDAVQDRSVEPPAPQSRFVDGGKEMEAAPSSKVDELQLLVTPRVIVGKEESLIESTSPASSRPQISSSATVAPSSNDGTITGRIAADVSRFAPATPGVTMTVKNGSQSVTDPSLLPGLQTTTGIPVTPRYRTAAPATSTDYYSPGDAARRQWQYVPPNTTAPPHAAETEKLRKRMKQRIAANEDLKSPEVDAFWSSLDEVETAAIGQGRGRAEGEARTNLHFHDSYAEQPSNEAYEPIVENDFLAPTVAPLSTFGVDVDTASYSNVRRFLTQNQLPPANAVRIEELLNYFKYNDSAPQGDKPFSCGLEAAACPWNPEHILVRIGLKGKEIPRTERPASNLVFLIDVSGSMKDDNKLPLVKSGLELLVGELTANDRVAIVTYAGHAGVALEPTSGNDKSKILQVIQGLSADGSTNGEGGLKLAYEQATKSFIGNGTNRVILCTDGDFNVGVSDDEELVQIIGRQAKTGVYLSIFGFGMGNIKDAKLEKLADRGNGHYGYVDGIREAQKIFVEEMTGTLYTIAKDVKVQVEFNPGHVGAYRLVGYENRVMAAQDFRNDAKDSGDIGAGHSVTALYEIIPVGKMPGKQPLKYQPTADAGAPVLPSQSPELLTLSLRYKRPETSQPPAPGVTTPVEAQKSVEEDYPLAVPTDAAAKTSDNFRWASAVAAFGMILRNSAHKGNADLRMVSDLASNSMVRWGGSNDLNFQTAEHVRRREFITLVEAARRLRGELPKPNNDGEQPKR